MLDEEVTEMAVLVVYASKHGATGEIAERVAQTMAAVGQQAQARPVTGMPTGSARTADRQHDARR